MKTKYNSYENNGIVSEKDYNEKSIINHAANEFYNEELATKHPVITIKRMGSVDRNEKWKILQDNKPVLIFASTKLSKKQREFLRTADGFNFLIAAFKSGIKSFSKLKAELRKRTQ